MQAAGIPFHDFGVFSSVFYTWQLLDAPKGAHLQLLLCQKPYYPPDGA